MKIDLEKLINLSETYISERFEREHKTLNKDVPEECALFERRHFNCIKYNSVKIIDFLENGFVFHDFHIGSNAEEILKKLQDDHIALALSSYVYEEHSLECDLSSKGYSISTAAFQKKSDLKEKYDKKLIDIFWKFLKFKNKEDFLIQERQNVVIPNSG